MSSSIRVVLVDDQALFRSGLAAVLDSQPDLEVVGQAGDGSESLRVIDETKPDVVLMDVRMEPMDGVTATRQIFSPSRVARGRKVPRVIVLTTFNLDDRAAQAIRFGASGFVLKDATPEFLAEAIRTVHAGNAVIASGDLAEIIGGNLRPLPQVPPAFRTLSDREAEIFHATAKGLNNSEIAAELHLSESTVKTHVGSILRKLKLRDRVQIVLYAHENQVEAPGGESPAP